YRPSGERLLPAFVYLFGGGWALGSIDTSDAICRSLANAAGCVVVTPGYRLAPEWKFPAAVLDCAAAVGWGAAQAAGLVVEPGRLAGRGGQRGGESGATGKR